MMSCVIPISLQNQVARNKAKASVVNKLSMMGLEILRESTTIPSESLIIAPISI